MSMCRVFSCVVGRGCLLWPVYFLGKTLLVLFKGLGVIDRVPDELWTEVHDTVQECTVINVRDQTTVSRTWVMFTRKRQDMRSSCLANHVTPATPVTKTKNCLYVSRHTPLFAALVRFPCVGWDLGPSALGINKLPSCVCNTVVDLLSRSVRRYGLGA